MKFKSRINSALSVLLPNNAIFAEYCKRSEGRGGKSSAQWNRQANMLQTKEIFAIVLSYEKPLYIYNMAHKLPQIKKSPSRESETQKKQEAKSRLGYSLFYAPILSSKKYIYKFLIIKQMKHEIHFNYFCHFVILTFYLHLCRNNKNTKFCNYDAR